MILKRRHTYTVLAFILLIILSLSSSALAEGMICRAFPDGEEQRAAQFDHTELLSPSVTQNLSYGELALARIVCGNDYFSDDLVRNVNASIYASYRQAYEASQMYMPETAKE